MIRAVAGLALGAAQMTACGSSNRGHGDGSASDRADGDTSEGDHGDGRLHAAAIGGRGRDEHRRFAHHAALRPADR
jgi:hypothetical protein